MEKECEQPLRIAMIGETGAGKSTFINTARQLSPNAFGAAETNSMKECTLEVQEYPDPRNPKLVYYDLPGSGSPNFSKEEYVTKLSLDRYDFFILLSCDRFKETDYYLAKQLDLLGKKILFRSNKN